VRDSFILTVLASLAAVVTLGAAPSVLSDRPMTALLVVGGVSVAAGLVELVRAALRPE
jgi:hypothetical protein